MRPTVESPYVNQVPITHAEYAVLGSCTGYGSGILSWHEDEFSAHLTRKNFEALGGEVEVAPAPNGAIPKDKTDKLHNLVIYS